MDENKRNDYRATDLSDKTYNHLEAVDGIFDSTNLDGAGFYFADLKRSRFHNANLKGTVFKNCTLEEADLSQAINLKENQFPGTNLSHATLPPQFEFSRLGHLVELSKNLVISTFSVLFAVFYSILVVGSTADKDLLFNVKSLYLPFLEMSLPVLGFYYISPLIILGIHIYFIFQLSEYIKFANELPAVFPDGLEIIDKTPPATILNVILVRSSPVLWKSRADHFMEKIRGNIIIYGVLFLCPAILVLFWLRFLARHDFVGSLIHCVVIVAASTISRRVLKKFTTTRSSMNTRSPLNTYLKTYLAPVLLFVLTFLISILVLFGPKINFPYFYVNIGNEKIIPGETLESQTRNKFAAKSFSLKEVNLRHAVMNNIKISNISLVGAVLDHADIRNGVFNHVKLTRARIRNAILSYTDFSGVFSQDVDFRHSDMKNVDFKTSNFSRSDFSYCDLKESKMDSGDFSRAKFNHAKLDFSRGRNTNFTMATFEDATLNQARFTKANFYLSNGKGLHAWNGELVECKFILADFSYADFTSSNLERSNFSQAILEEVVFKNANMKKTIMIFAKLPHADFSGADLTRANFSHAQLQNTNFSKATLRGAYFHNAWFSGTNVKGADLTGAKGLAARHIKGMIYDENTRFPAYLRMGLQPGAGQDGKKIRPEIMDKNKKNKKK